MPRIMWLGLLCLPSLGCGIVGLDDGDALEGTFSGPYAETYNYQSLSGGGGSSCVVSYNVTGTVSLVLAEPGGSKPGTIDVEWSETMSGKTGNGCGNEGGNRNGGMGGDLMGTAADFRFSDQRIDAGSLPITTRLTVAGAQSGDGATATVTLSRTASGTITTTGINLNGSASWSVALR